MDFTVDDVRNREDMQARQRLGLYTCLFCRVILIVRGSRQPTSYTSSDSWTFGLTTTAVSILFLDEMKVSTSTTADT
jgi:hypothetical protein